MAIEWCENCGEMKFDFSVHKCLPKWEVREEDFHGEDDWDFIFAISEKSAAEKYAARADIDSAEYHFINGSDARVLVRNIKTKEVKAFHIIGETVPQYTARETKEGA